MSFASAHPPGTGERVGVLSDPAYAVRGMSWTLRRTYDLGMVVWRPASSKACRLVPVVMAPFAVAEYVLIGGPQLWRALLFVGMALGVLLLNQRHPFASPLAALVVLSVFALVDPQAGTDPNSPLFIVMFCLFVLGAFLDERRAVLGGLLALGCVAVIVLCEPHPDVSGMVVLALLIVLAWGAGRLAALRNRLGDQLAAQQERAEAERTAEAQKAVELERARIARELHDVVAHHLSVIVVQARGGRRSLVSSPDEAWQAFDAIETMGGEAMIEMRQLLGVLRHDAHGPGAPLSPRPSLSRLDALADQLHRSGQRVDITVDGTPSPLPPGLDLAAYRIVQEALTNVVKHTQLAAATVGISYQPFAIRLLICDDGPSRTPSTAAAAGQGLVGMQERVALYGGTLRTGPRPRGGHVVDVTLPIPSP